MFAAVSLGVFEGNRDLGAAGDRLLDACVALGLLRREGGAYVNTAVSEEYLTLASPRTLAGYVLYSNRALYPMWAHLEDAVREGGHRWSQTFGSEGPLFSSFFATPQATRTFLQGMHGFGVLSSPAVVRAFDLSGFRRMVDLGGGTGHLVEAAMEGYPGLSAAVFDLPEVVAVARELARAGLEFLAGDFFEDELPEADLFALGQILHDWSADKIALLLRRIWERLPPRGGLLIAERLLEPGAVAAHMQSLNMLVCTEGRERTAEQYRELLEAAGFGDVRWKVTGTVRDAVLARKV
ncbi:MAG: homocysteine methyltransferase [Bryobacteraceae bacterium]|nr:homocysteine methyltransferase [Bryobacteraceae bacterium]